MKKLLLVLVLILTPVAAQAGWRHYAYYWDGLAHLLHPSGVWWTCDKYVKKCKH
jgi:hypothetical protein